VNTVCRNTNRGCLLVAVLAIVGAAHAQPGPRVRLVPHDDAAHAPGFAPVLARFRKAVQDRNAAEVLAITSPSPLFSNPDVIDAGTRAGFRRFWKLDDPKSDFWTEAEQLLRVGGSSAGGDCADGCEVWYPSWEVAFPDDLDPVDYAVVTGNDVPVYELPRAGSRVLTRLTYDVVKLLVEGDRWTRIVLPDGREGYVDGAVAGRVAGAAKYMLWSPQGGSEMGFYRRNNGPWLLTVFYAPD
jgi:hypothetical protein